MDVKIDPNTVKVTLDDFQPKALGMVLVKKGFVEGFVTEVHDDGQSKDKGVKVGWTLIKINGEAYSLDGLIKIAKGDKTFSLTFDTNVLPKKKVVESKDNGGIQSIDIKDIPDSPEINVRVSNVSTRSEPISLGEVQTVSEKVLAAVSDVQGLDSKHQPRKKPFSLKSVVTETETDLHNLGRIGFKRDKVGLGMVATISELQIIRKGSEQESPRIQRGTKSAPSSIKKKRYRNKPRELRWSMPICRNFQISRDDRKFKGRMRERRQRKSDPVHKDEFLDQNLDLFCFMMPCSV